MTKRTTALAVMIIVGATLVACPTRQNPDLPDGWDDEVGDGDVSVDADSFDCGANRQWCDEACVPNNSNDHCGDCVTQCDTSIEGCDCQRRGGEDDLHCWLVIAGHPTSWELCELE